MMTAQENIQNVENLIRRLEARFKVFRDETDRIVAEKTELLEKKKGIELTIKDLLEDVGQERAGRGNSEDALNRLRQEIERKNEELNTLIPRFDNLTEREKQLQADISINEQKCRELNAKLGRKEQFSNVKERDNYLLVEVNATKKQMQETDRQIADITRSIDEDKNEAEQLEHQIQECEKQLNEISTQIDTENQNLKKLKIKADSENIRRKDALLQEDRAQNELRSLKAEISSAEESLMSLAPKVDFSF